MRNRAVADDIGGVIEKTAVHPSMNRQLDLARHKRSRWRWRDDSLRQYVCFAIPITSTAVLGRFVVPSCSGWRRRCVHLARRIVGSLLDRKFRLFLVFL